MVKAQQSHLCVCGKHNRQINLFVCTEMGVSQSIFKVIKSEVTAAVFSRWCLFNP